MLSILITNAYSARNRGDAGILLGMLSDLGGCPRFRGAKITISTQDYPGDKGQYACDVAPSFHSLKDRFSRHAAVNCLCFLTGLLPLSLLWAAFYRVLGKDPPFGGEFGALMRSYTSADVVVAAGGGYLCTTAARRGVVILLIHLYSFYLPVLLGKPVYLYSQSVGPFAHPLHAWLTRRALAGVRLVQAREALSAELLASWRLRIPVHLTVDAGFLTPVSDCPVCLSSAGDRKRIGVTVRRWFREDQKQAGYEAVFQQFLCWLTEQRGVNLYFLPQVTAAGIGDDDRVVARRLMKSVRLAQLVEQELSAPQLKALCGQMDFFVATRLHSAVFAAAMLVPGLVIAYQPKAYGIMKQLELEEFVLPIEGLSLPRLQERYCALVTHGSELRERLGKVMPRVTARVRENSRIIAEDLLVLGRPAGGWSPGDGDLSR